MTEVERVINDLNVAKLMLCNPQMLTPEMCIRIGQIVTNAIDLLKEQEAREPHYTILRYRVNGTEVTAHHPECPKCIENGLMLWDAEIEKGQAYCKRCGQAVKWDGNE